MKSDWSQGYVTETIYTDGFYRELSPAWINYVAALKGCLPIATDRPFTYLELGCGLGRSTTVLAGAFPAGRFIGVDFNPAHVALAQRYADDLAIGNVEFMERSFQDLANENLPVCDYIVLHGVYTWVSPDARQAIRRIILDRLRPGGLVYVSYNCLPGWSSAAPLRKLMYEAAAENVGPLAGNVAPALGLMEKLASGQLGYFKANGAAEREIKRFKERGTNYLAHEFLNADWTLFYSVDVAAEMAEAKLTYLGSATLPENHFDLMVDRATAELIEARPSSRMRQLLLDFAVNQRFRRDVFVRGHQHLTGTGQMKALHQIPFGTLKPTEAFAPKTKVGCGEIAYHPQLFPHLKELFQQGVFTMKELSRLCAERSNKPASVDRTVSLMAAADYIVPCATASSPGLPKPSNMPVRLRIEDESNQILLKSGAGSNQVMISRTCGTGISIEPFETVALTLMVSEKFDPKSLRKRLIEEMKQRGLRLTSKGQVVREEAETQKVVGDLLDGFLKDRLPVLIRMGIVSVA